MSVECGYCGNKNHDWTCPKHPRHSKEKKPKSDCHEGCSLSSMGVAFHSTFCINHPRKEMTDKLSYDAVKTTGEKREFSTGSVRHSRKGKGRYDLIPPGPLRRLAKHYENGAREYGDRNWEKGQPISSYIDSMLRHGQDYLSGDRSEDHLAAVAWNAFAAMFTEEKLLDGTYPIELDDLPTKVVGDEN